MVKDKTPEQQKIHSEMMKDAKNVLEKYKCTVLLTGSALLGAYRDKNLIPWCYGAVFTTFFNQIKPHENDIISDFKNYGFKIEKHFKGEHNYKIRIARDGFNIEIVAYAKNKKYFYRKLSNKKKVIPKNFLRKPYGKIKLYDTVYKAPGDIEGFLSFIYKDWKTPIKSMNPSEYKNSDHMVIDK